MSNKRICACCQGEFMSVQPKAKYCSDKCRKENYNFTFGRFSVEKIATSTVGTITEMAVAIEMLRNGWAVFRALSPACHCDLIATKKDKIIKVEVRTGYKGINEKLTYSKAKKDTPDRYDVMAVKIWRENKIYYFDNENNPINIENGDSLMKICKNCGDIESVHFTDRHEDHYCEVHKAKKLLKK